MTQTDTVAPPSADEPTRTSPSEASSVVAAKDRRPDLAPLIDAYFKHVPPEDQPRRVEDVIGTVRDHRALASRRGPGDILIRVFNPRGSMPALDHAPSSDGDGDGDATRERPKGWAATSTVIDIVNDDMRYLVESVIGALTQAGVTVHRVLHPILQVRRDAEGRLLEAPDPAPRGVGDGHSVRESWMHLLIDRLSDAERAETIESALHDALTDARAVNLDADLLTAAAVTAARDLRSSTSPRSVAEVIEAADLLDWLAAGNLTFLGYRQVDAAGQECSGPDPADSAWYDSAAYDNAIGEGPGRSSLGVLRPGTPLVEALDEEIGALGTDSGELLVMTSLTTQTALTRQVAPFYLAVRIVGEDGAVTGEHRFVGMLNPRALNAEITTIPVLRGLSRTVLQRLGAEPGSYTGQRATDLLATYPRAELFWASPDQVLQIVGGVLQLSSRRRLRAFLQRDPYERFVSVLVFLPRDRYTTDARLAMQDILVEALGGSGIRYTARVGDSLLAAVHFTVRTDPSRPVHPDLPELTARLRATVRSWDDRLLAAVVGGTPGRDEDLDTAGALSRYSDAFDEPYKKVSTPEEAVRDLRRLDALSADQPLDLAFSEPVDPNDPGEVRRLKLYVVGAAVTLSRALPVLQDMGAEVIDERPYEARRSDGTLCRIYDFGLRFPPRPASVPASATLLRELFSAAFIAAWDGRAEVDGFNALVLAAALDWRTVSMLRSYAHYIRQIGSPYTQGYLEQVLLAHPGITADLARLFEARFEPAESDAAGPGAEREQAITARVTGALDEVSSLDADRILRLYLQLILATDRTNFYRRGPHERGALAFKLDPHRVPAMPKPVPKHEIWVYSPRVEGVHLRFGDVARGGLRWSDRPEDFRTEVLGLVKAQEVKNAVIVPVGAKGGFVVKHPPVAVGSPAADREAALAEGVACYRAFIAGLLDLTDNRVDGEVVPPPRVLRHDRDDPYLVVAADKGTASFSDIANQVALDYGFWLGDAFASGGSAGYDHKAMGITARGAWESVKHHFRELGVDTQREDFTCVGVGDMSGDVFGNGMLLSQHIRLVAAFDHRHVFVDPTPDASESFVERMRLYELPRSSWADYDTALISAGGGVFARTAKSVPITGEMRAALGIEDGVEALTPVELISAILRAPVDLLWNGGIGTYVKASTESNLAVGDKANDPLRVNGADLRARVVGEGGNLGVTQLGRIEFALAGGRINTDAIDNSAGVDTSDHEVNIKIALQPEVTRGALDLASRAALLVSMTDEVATLVLADNTAQNRLLGVSRYHARVMVSVHARLLDALEAAGKLDRRLEFLPTAAQLDARAAIGEGLTSPELAVLIAYVKMVLSASMLASDLPDLGAYRSRLPDYFPAPMRAEHATAIDAHPLGRQIVTTMTVNDVVNLAGISYAFRLSEEIAASATDAIRAFTVAAEVFGLPALWADIAALDNRVPPGCQDLLTLSARRLLDRAVRWLLTGRPQPLDVRREIERYAEPINRLIPRLPRLVTGIEYESVRSEAAGLVERGAPPDLAYRVAYSLFAFSLLDVADVAAESGRSLDEVAELYYALSAHLEFDWLLSAVTSLDRGDRWHALARQALRDDLYRSMRMITADVLSTSAAGQDVHAKIDQWERENASRLVRARTTLGQIVAHGGGDLAALSVAAREIRTMIR